MTSKAKLKSENTFLRYRVQFLETQICKGQHDYVEIDKETQFDGPDDFAYVRTKQCLRCGKIIKERSDML